MSKDHRNWDFFLAKICPTKSDVERTAVQQLTVAVGMKIRESQFPVRVLTSKYYTALHHSRERHTSRSTSTLEADSTPLKKQF
jgi:hypothetical protein